MKTSFLKRCIVFILLVCTYIILFYGIMPIIIRGSTDVFSGEKVVLITGDFYNEESFGNNVLNGFNAALSEKGKNKIRFKYETISISENLVQNASGSINIETNEIEKVFKKELISKISSRNIIAIISANTSQTISPCLEVGETFNIPVLITVATNSEVTKEFNGISFRLLANNGIQAEAIINWMENYNENSSSYFGILYSPTIYGNNLLNVIRSKVGFEHVIPFSISTTTDMVGTIEYGEKIGVSAWVSLSYLKESIEIQVKKEHLDNNNTPILFSDGAYGSWIEELNNNKEKNIFLAFPETYPADRERIKGVSGFGVFGYDAFWLIDYCLESEASINKTIFAKKLCEFEMPLSSNLVQKYKFEDGENTLAKFKIYSIYEIIP